MNYEMVQKKEHHEKKQLDYVHWVYQDHGYQSAHNFLSWLNKLDAWEGFSIMENFN